ncbi:adenine phosphoribosyltransferase 4-like isoform X2 [Oryza brachyantha]|uniref:adenine phosphoribosyltransferase 4-like isoform X2 n=1 Tax=Oryza brachyantha TaxID=4533 RepID=UPI001AD9675D|nr:adenine phosphoribosyltransferase 4-like isoform X2 [Oryza brachyantha]
MYRFYRTKRYIFASSYSINHESISELNLQGGCWPIPPLFIHTHLLTTRRPPLASSLSLSLSLSDSIVDRERKKKRESGESRKAMAVSDEKKKEMQDPRTQGIASTIRVVPNFPKPGIMFQDITTLLVNPKVFKDTIDLFVERYTGKGISAVAGEVMSEEYVLEYGADCLQMHVGAVQPGERALVVDDLVATGGTLCAAIALLERAGAEVVECACVIELPELKGRERLKGKPLYILVESHS